MWHWGWDDKIVCAISVCIGEVSWFPVWEWFDRVMLTQVQGMIECHLSDPLPPGRVEFLSSVFSSILLLFEGNVYIFSKVVLFV